MNPISLHELGEIVTDPKYMIGCEDYYAESVYRFIDAYTAYTTTPNNRELLNEVLSAFKPVKKLYENDRFDIEPKRAK